MPPRVDMMASSSVGIAIPAAPICSGLTPMPVAIMVIWSADPPALSRKPVPAMPPTTARISNVRAIHMKNWVRATNATPIILPKRSSVALTDETRTSTTRLDFSSITLDITMPQNIDMNM